MRCVALGTTCSPSDPNADTNKHKHVALPQPATVSSRFSCEDLTAVLAPTLPRIFQHFSPQFQTKYQKQDHSTMIKGKTQNEK